MKSLSNASPLKHQSGFTLIELMIAVAIIGILSAIALPAYNDYVRRGQVTEATAFLSDFKVKMEQYYQDNKNYGVADCTDAANAPTWAAFADSKYFGYTCALTGNGQGYLITATGTTAAASGHIYTVNHNGAQTTTKFKGETVAKNCWILKGSEC